jgi:DNA-3-methyladenine glycosylase
VQRLTQTFAERSALVVAPALLNKIMVVGGHRARITEVEAYTADDPASHSFGGRTNRNGAMFGPAGSWYVYLIYGLHHCINLVTGADGDGQAVLIRSVVVDGFDPRSTSGPGRLTRILGIDRSFDGSVAELFDDGLAAPSEPLVGPRVGVTKAVDWPRRWRID